MTDRKLEREEVRKAMKNIEEHEKILIGEALKLLGEISSLKIYGPKNPEKRTSLISFNYEGKTPFEIAEGLNKFGVESRAGCHCATLAHHYYKLDPPASCRLSFYIYNDLSDVKKACKAVKKCVEPNNNFFSKWRAKLTK
jgi:cysteine desulfurase/selenocysteine lyase